jgi:hypothetical protein
MSSQSESYPSLDPVLPDFDLPVTGFHYLGLSAEHKHAINSAEHNGFLIRKLKSYLLLNVTLL